MTTSSSNKTSIAYKYAKLYERAETLRQREAVAREIQRRAKDKRLSANNVRFLRHIVNYHVRQQKGLPGHRPTVHTMLWPSPGNMRSGRR